MLVEVWLVCINTLWHAFLLFVTLALVLIFQMYALNSCTILHQTWDPVHMDVSARCESKFLHIYRNVKTRNGISGNETSIPWKMWKLIYHILQNEYTREWQNSDDSIAILFGWHRSLHTQFVQDAVSNLQGIKNAHQTLVRTQNKNSITYLFQIESVEVEALDASI